MGRNFKPPTPNQLPCESTPDVFLQRFAGVAQNPDDRREFVRSPCTRASSTDLQVRKHRSAAVEEDGRTYTYSLRDRLSPAAPCIRGCGWGRQRLAPRYRQLFAVFKLQSSSPRHRCFRVLLCVPGQQAALGGRWLSWLVLACSQKRLDKVPRFDAFTSSSRANHGGTLHERARTSRVTWK